MLLRITIFAICILPLVGCSSFAPFSKSLVGDTPSETVPPPKAPAPVTNSTTTMNQPARMAIIWNENVLQAPGKAAKRGYVGRIYFYNSSDQLVQVDGELKVYLYDDTLGKRSDVADRIFVFPADKFQERYNPSELGHSYSVWIPCSDYGDVRKSLTLIPKFVTNDGQTVMGKPNRLSLSGRTPNEQLLDRQLISGTMEPSANYSDHQRNGRRSDTIPIPQEIADRIRNAPASRIPPAHVTQNLNDMESSDFNPEGDRFNRVRVQQNMNNHNHVPYQHSTANFSDGGQWARPNQPQSYQGHGQSSQPGYQSYGNSDNSRPVSQFGRPGSIR